MCLIIAKSKNFATRQRQVVKTRNGSSGLLKKFNRKEDPEMKTNKEAVVAFLLAIVELVCLILELIR